MSGSGELLIESLSHDYSRVDAKAAPIAALRDINLKVTPGSFVSIIGSSGCGKSTLLRIIAGLVEPTSGALLLDGQPSIGTDNRKGLVFQQDAVFPWLTVKKNIEYGLKVRGVSRSERQARADDWAKLVGLEGFLTSYPKELSGGMRKRVDLARVYASDPEILLMDEPFGALDAQTKERMQEELLKIWENRRKTVIFVTHDLDEAVFLSDRVVIMSPRPGRIARVVDVDFARPRTADIRLTEQFMQLKRLLTPLLSESGDN